MAKLCGAGQNLNNSDTWRKLHASQRHAMIPLHCDGYASIQRTCLTFIRLCQTNPKDKEAKCQLSSSIYQIMRNLNCTDISWAAFKDHERRISHAAVQHFVPLVSGAGPHVCVYFESINKWFIAYLEKKKRKERAAAISLSWQRWPHAPARHLKRSIVKIASWLIWYNSFLAAKHFPTFQQ